MSVASTRAETFDGFDDVDYPTVEAPAAPTLSEAEVADELRKQGWIPEVNGSHAEAWRLYWGKECVTETLAPHPAWVGSLARTTEKSYWDKQVQTLMPILTATAGEETTLPSCEFISTPWVDELAPTRGRIFVSSELYRINDQLSRNPHGCLRAGVIVLGQTGVGKTYLAYYLLIRQLAAQKMTLFSPKPDLYLFFHPSGVFRASSLPTTPDGWPTLQSIAPQNIWLIIDTTPGENEPKYSVATDRFYFPVQLCRPERKHYRRWQEWTKADFLALDAPLPQMMLAGALLQVDIRPRKDDLGRLLQHILHFGLRPCVCFRDLGGLERKRLALDEYISTLNEEQLEYIVKYSFRGWNFASRLHSDERPDIYILRCNSRDGIDALVPTVSSRYTMDRLRHHLGYDSLVNFQHMEAVHNYYEGLENTRFWLFEQLCHSLLSSPAGTADSLRLTPCNPNKAGLLRLEHLLAPRTVRHYNQQPPSFDPSFYCISKFPANEALHAIAYVLPSSQDGGSAKAGPSTMPQRVTRSSVRRAATEAARGHRSTTTSPISTRSRAKRGQPDVKNIPLSAAAKTPTRMVVFFQLLVFSKPLVAARHWARVESTMAKIRAEDVSMASATYCMVFVSLRGEELDARTIPKHWSKQMTLYHLEVDIPSE